MKSIIALVLIFINFFSQAYAQTDILPAKNLFNPPVADPRWPKFSMGVARDFSKNFGKTIWTFNFGENIGLVRFGSVERPFEFGIQAASFGAMNIHSNPSVLINNDYFVGIGLSHRHDHFQYLWQVSHVSSHVGDELLLTSRNIKRVNLSYETVKWFMRYKNPLSSFSPYMQLGYIVHVDPSYVKRFSIAGGIDYLSSKPAFISGTRFVAGGFINSWQENKFKPTINIRAGLQFEKTEYYGRYLQVLLEYQNGPSQYGQFYNLKTNYIGLLVTFSS
jgi:hypothetical protein